MFMLMKEKAVVCVIQKIITEGVGEFFFSFVLQIDFDLKYEFDWLTRRYTQR